MAKTSNYSVSCYALSMITRPPTGFLLIDKPASWTSFDVVAKLRGITGIKKIGHAGTLDPFATGLLIVAVGRDATKQIDRFTKMDKVYETTFVLGKTSTTHDPEGDIEVTATDEQVKVACEQFPQTVPSFIGDLQQIPPMHSAIKVDGQRLYKLARQGKTVEREPRSVHIKRFEISNMDCPNVDAVIEVSSGTYIRAIARDVGENLQVGAYLSSLRRISIGEYLVADAVPIDEVTPENWHTLLFQ